MNKRELFTLATRAASLNFEAHETTKEFEDALGEFLGIEDIYDTDNIGCWDSFIDIIEMGNGNLSEEQFNRIMDDICEGHSITWRKEGEN